MPRPKKVRTENVEAQPTEPQELIYESSKPDLDILAELFPELPEEVTEAKEIKDTKEVVVLASEEAKGEKEELWWEVVKDVPEVKEPAQEVKKCAIHYIVDNGTCWHVVMLDGRSHVVPRSVDHAELFNLNL